jgi:enoyl-CoA hydratase
MGYSSSWFLLAAKPTADRLPNCDPAAGGRLQYLSIDLGFFTKPGEHRVVGDTYYCLVCGAAAEMAVLGLMRWAEAIPAGSEAVMTKKTFSTVLVETRGRVGLITLNRPQALNALNGQLIAELNEVLDAFEGDANIGCIVLMGSDKAFAAGADIKEMATKSYMDVYMTDHLASWERVSRCRKPVIAAVAGFALGGGCELAMMCDFILAADNAKFGQPEIKLGVLPGAGGSQRLTRLVGRSKAMEMCLTGRMMDAAEAERAGLVSRIVPAADLVNEAVATATAIASMSLPVTMLTKDCVNRADETTLAEGVRYERRVFHAMFATRDQKEGMAAFIEKRKPNFSHE